MMRDTSMFSESNYWTADLALSSLAIALVAMLAGKSIVGFLGDGCRAGYTGAMILRWSESQRGGVGQVAPAEAGDGGAEGESGEGERGEGAGEEAADEVSEVARLLAENARLQEEAQENAQENTRLQEEVQEVRAVAQAQCLDLGS